MGHRRDGREAGGRLARRRAVVIVLGAVGLLLAACSGPSASPRVASLGSTTTTTAATQVETQDTTSPSDYAKDVAYAECMRTHGEPSFPDPNAQGDFLFSGGLRPGSPRFISANKVCAHLEPDAGVQTAADQREALTVGLKVSACMRRHGVPDFPDPTSSGDLIWRDQSGAAGAQLTAAMKACQSLFDEFGAIP